MMMGIENSNKINILHVVVGTSDQELAYAAKVLGEVTWGERLFLRMDKEHRSRTERILKERCISVFWNMVVFTAVDHQVVKMLLPLAKIAKDRKILSVVIAESETWSAAEYLERQSLHRGEICSNADCILLLYRGQEQTMRDTFYRKVDAVLISFQEFVEDVGFINLDFDDVSYILRDAEIAYMRKCRVCGSNGKERLNKLMKMNIIPAEMLPAVRRTLMDVSGCMDMGLEELETTCNVMYHERNRVIFGARFCKELSDEVQVTVLFSCTE